MAIIADLAVMLGINTAQFYTGLKGATGAIRAFQMQTSLMGGPLSKVAGLLGSLSNPAMLAATGIGAVVGASVAMASGVTAAMHTAEEFNQGMQRVIRITGDVGSAMRGEMVGAALEVSKNFKFSGAEASSGLEAIAAAGFNAEGAVALLPQVAQFAQAGMFDMNSAAQLSVDTLTAMGLKTGVAADDAAQLGRVMDVITVAASKSTSTVEEMAIAMQRAAGQARIAGINVEETAAMLATFAQAGIKGEEAGTAFTIAMRELTTRAIKNSGAWDANGVAVYDWAGNVRNTVDIIRDLENKLDGLSDREKKQLLMELGFRDKSIAFVQRLFGNSEAMQKFREAVDQSAGATKAMSDLALTPLEESLNKLRGTWEEVAVGAASPLNLEMAKLIDLVTDLVSQTDAVIEFSKSLYSIADALAIDQLPDNPITAPSDAIKGWKYFATSVELAVKDAQIAMSKWEGPEWEGTTKKLIEERQKILEDVATNIHGFDLTGNPVPHPGDKETQTKPEQAQENEDAIKLRDNLQKTIDVLENGKDAWDLWHAGIQEGSDDYIIITNLQEKLKLKQEEAKAAKEVEQKQQQLNQTVENFSKKQIEAQWAAVLTGYALERQKLAMQGVNEATLQFLDVQQQKLEELKKEQAMQKASVKVMADATKKRDSLLEDAMTEAEKFVKKSTELQLMFANGIITQAEFDKLRARAIQDISKGSGNANKATPAALLGSREAYSTITQYHRKENSDYIKRTALAAEKQLTEQQASNLNLQAIKQATQLELLQ